MTTIALSGNAGGAGAFTIAVPSSANTRTLTLPDATTTLVGTDATQTLTNKTLTSPVISGAVMTTMASSVITSGTAVTTTSGSTVDFTGIPTWAKRITVMWNNVSLTTADKQFVRLGTAGTGIYTSGYKCGYGSMSGTGASTDLFWFAAEGTAAQFNSGLMTIVNVSGNNWSQTCNSTRYPTNGFVSAGGITLDGPITTVRIGNDGTGTFDSGIVNIFYE